MTERGNGATAGGGPKPAPETDPLELRARLERFGEILARGLDLAEAGMTLGLTVLGTVGAAAQNKIIDRILNPAAEAPATEPQPAPAGPVATPVAAPVAAPGAGEAASYGITNRLPLKPGDPLSISFSVNNDSPVAGKEVRLLVEAFSGERSGVLLPADSLTVRPGEQSIAPMDFEKFILEGRIPADALPDRYRGSVVVLGDGPMRIPVLLMVESVA